MNNMNAEGGAIVIEKEGELHVLSSFAIKMPESFLDSDMIWKVIKEQKRLIVHLPEDIILSGLLVDFRPKEILVEPIMYKEVVLGVIVLAGVNSFTAEVQSNMELFGHGLALAFRNAITHDQLQRLAANDPLTGIFNRRFGLTRLKDEYHRAVVNSLHIGILIFDIDHFKKVNDTYGHLVGDKVIVRLAQTAKLALREGDVFIRYGGEEFLVVLPGASLVDTRQIADRIRHLVEDTEIKHNHQVIKVTVSIGGTSCPEREANEITAIIGVADKNLYKAKDLGRNMIVID